MPAKARHLKPNQLLHELGEIDLAHVAVVHQGAVERQGQVGVHHHVALLGEIEVLA